jgi:hypothetical protein
MKTYGGAEVSISWSWVLSFTFRQLYPRGNFENIVTILGGGVGTWLIRRCFGLHYWIYWHLIHCTRDYGQLQRYHYSTHFAVHCYSLHYSYPGNGFITDHCKFKLHIKSYFHSLIPFLLFCKSQFSSSPLLPSSYPGRLASRNSTQLNWTPLYNHFALTMQKTQLLYCWEGVLTAPLPSNGSYSTIALLFFAAGMCLPSCCLAMHVYSDFTILDFGRHVKLLSSNFLIVTSPSTLLTYDHASSLS